MLEKSTALMQRGFNVLPECCNTASKSPLRYVGGISPPILVRGEGAYVYDADGNQWLDTVGSLGAIILGHQYPAVDEAIAAQLKKGFCFSMTSEPEILLAEKLTALTGYDMVRFGKNGKDATMMGVRLARAHTGKMGIAYCGYHGCDSWYCIDQMRNAGEPKELKDYVYSFPFNDLVALEKIFTESFSPDDKGSFIGVVIMEQGPDDPAPGFYKGVRELCDKYGALFILDEVVTGFRYGIGGARAMYGIEPDILCLGKAMANGLPLSACLARKEIMSRLGEDVFFSLTFGGEQLSIAACLAVINELETKPITARLEELGNYWLNTARQRITMYGLQDTLQIAGNGFRSGLRFAEGVDAELIRSIWIQEMAKKGVLAGVPIYMNASFTHEDVDTMLKGANEALRIIGIGLRSENGLEQYLEGERAGVVLIGSRR